MTYPHLDPCSHGTKGGPQFCITCLRELNDMQDAVLIALHDFIYPDNWAPDIDDVRKAYERYEETFEQWQTKNCTKVP